MWRNVWSRRSPCKTRYSSMWTRREILIETASTRCYARAPRGRAKEWKASVEQETELTADDLWNDVSARLREALNDTTYSTWFGEVDGVQVDGDQFVMAVPNDFTREWIEGHFLDLLRATVRDAGGAERRIGFQVVETVPPPASGPVGVPSAVRPLPLEVAPRSELAGINPKYT